MKSICLYPINAIGVVEPHYTVQKAFENAFNPCYTYDWCARSSALGNNLKKVHNEFLEILKQTKPYYAFMQIQGERNMSVEMIREMSKHTKIINWTGDVRDTKEWYEWLEAIGREIYLTLFTNVDDVRKLTEKGIRADYLQIGYDPGWYYPGGEKSGPEIVFCANNFNHFPLSQYRRDVAIALSNEFGSNFKLYGSGWDNTPVGRKRSIGCREEGEVYRSAKIAISVSNFDLDRYHSDRLLRIMGCGCMALSHNYKGIEHDFVESYHLMTFDDIKSLIDTCRYFLQNNPDRQFIAQNGYDLVSSEHTWDVRCAQLKQILEKWS